MARINVYLPDDLASQARAARLNVSSVTQAALRRELGALITTEWRGRVRRLRAARIDHQQVLSALDAAREDFGRPRG